MSTVLQPVRQFSRGGGFSGTLQARHENHRWGLGGKFEFGCIAAQKLDQLIADDLDDLFPGRQRGHNLLAERLVLDLVNELLNHLEADVGLQQRKANLAERLLNVVLIQDGLAAQRLKSSV